MTAPASDMVTPLGPSNTPWAMQEVSRKDGKGEGKGRVIRFEPVRKPRKNPWELPVSGKNKDKIHLGASPPPLHGPPAWTEEEPEEQPLPEKKKEPKRKRVEGEGKHLICAQNYAAIEAGAERYGLIDMGPIDAGSRRLLTVHARKNNKAPHSILNTIRPGSVLFVKRGRRVGRTMQLHVRFTTPAKYYSPGAKMSTLSVGVDEVDWQSLIADARHI